MKNNESTQITQARQGRVAKIAIVDLTSDQETVIARIATTAPQRRKRRINYTKKIMNDPFLFKV